MKKPTKTLRRTALSLAATLGLGMGITLAMGTAQAQEAFKIGYIYPSPAADVGWAHELDEGRRAVEEHFGDKVESIIIENIPDGPDAARIMNQLAAQGVDMMMLGSFGYMNDGLKTAKRYPDIDFIHASGYKVADNLGNFLTRNHESAYVAGMAAGYVTESGTIGMVASYAIPEVIGIINSFTLGAQSTNPDISVKIVWLNSWFDPSKAQESARSLIAQQSDVIFSIYQDTPSVVTVAEEEGVYVVNTSSDMKAYAPTHLLASMKVSWGNYFIDKVQASMDDSFVGDSFWGGMADEAVSLESISDDLSAEQRAAVDAKIDAITAGEFNPFSGPVIDQEGNEKVAAGKSLSDGDLLSISWLVQGIDTKLPQ